MSPTQAALVLLAPFSLLTADERLEPPLRFKLSVGNSEQFIKADQPFQIDGKNALLQASTTRNFKAAGLSFPYPAAFSFESSVGEASPPTFRSWVLSGNDCKLLIQAFHGKVPLRSYAEKYAASVTGAGSDGPVIKKGTIHLGQKLDSVSIATTNLGSRIQLLLVDLGIQNGWQRILIVQDFPGKTEARSPEAIEAIRLLTAELATDA